MAEEKTFKPGPTSRRNRAVLGSWSTSRQSAALAGKLQLPGDALLFIYLAVLSRQYLWWVTDNNLAAWIAAASVAAIVSWLYVSTKEFTEEETVGLPFWLVAVLPLVFVYSMRVVFPDVSFDVLNYRLLHGERALTGFIYLPGEFFPTPGPYNPAPDMVTGIFRHALGYRLGTIANLLAMIWVARIADKLLRPFWRNAWLRAAGVLLALMAEHLLFEINNYMADLLALPLLLEATYLALRHAGWKNQRRNLAAIALLLGMSVAFKLTNAAIALPIVLLCAYRVVTRKRSGDKRGAMPLKELAPTTLLCALAFILPLVPFSAYLYRETGSLAFPVFNGFFKSVYWPANSLWDPRWGPNGLWEKLAWPILISLKPERLSELTVYSGRISFGFVAALIGLIVVRREARLREFCFLVVAASLFWSASTGYIRYALYVEILAPIVVLALVAKLAYTNQAGKVGQRAGLLVACLLGAGLIFQACLAANYISGKEWSARPTIFTQPGAYKHEAQYLLRDRSLRKFLSPELRDEFDRVEVWIVSSMKTSSLEVMLQPKAPMIGVNTGEYFLTAAGRARFDEALARVSGKRVFTLAFAEDLSAAQAALRERGLVARETVPVAIPFYARDASINIFLIEVARSTADASAVPHNSVGGVVSDYDPAYHAEISASQKPGVMTVGEKKVLQLTVRNAGNNVWRSRVPQGWMNIVTLGDRWLTLDGTGVVNEMDSRTALPRDLKPGEQAELTLTVTAPQSEGEYLLEIDMVHEGVTWFYQRGSPTLRWVVKVVE